MQKDLLKLALAGLAAGACLSAQQGGSEIAMTKCSKTPSANQEQQIPQKGDVEEEGVEDMDDNMNDATNPNPGSCAGGCGANQGNGSSNNEEIHKHMGSKRLSAAKAAMAEEDFRSLNQ